jgi:hypothetical protein
LADQLAEVAAIGEQPLGMRLLEDPVPICTLGMCDAIASTGAPVRCAS